MLKFYKTIDNVTREIQTPEAGCWISAVSPSEEERNFLEALIHANKVMIEDMMREAGYMLPQSSNTNKLLCSLKNKDHVNGDIIDKLLEKIEVND